MKILLIILGTLLLATYGWIIYTFTVRPRWFERRYWEWARSEAAHFEREWKHWFVQFNTLSNLAWDALVEDERGEDTKNDNAQAKLRKFLRGGS